MIYKQNLILIVRDLRTTTLGNDSPLRFLDPIEPINSAIIVEQWESRNINTNSPENQNYTPPEKLNKKHWQTQSTTPPSKKKNEIIKDPAFFTSPVYAPFVSTKNAL